MASTKTSAKRGFSEVASSSELSPASTSSAQRGAGRSSEPLCKRGRTLALATDSSKKLFRKERTEKLKSIFLGKDNKLAAELSDVEFEVTDALSGDKCVFHSIRALCAAFSPVMKAMLFGHMEEAQLGCSVPIAGCRVEGFQWLLAYFYGLDPVLTLENVVSVLQCADRFLVDEPAHECVAFISKKMADGIDSILPLAAEIERLKIGSIPGIKETVDSLRANPHFVVAAIKSPKFAKSQIFVVDAILRSDSLPVAEEILWQLVVEWAKQQWADGTRAVASESMEEVTDDSRVTDHCADSGWRDLMRPFLPRFRFPLMDQTFFCKEVLPCGLLTSDESLSVIMAKTVKGSACVFSSAPRGVEAMPVVVKKAQYSQILSAKEFCDLQKKAYRKNFVHLEDCRLLFRASRDGFGAAQFHDCCDKKGATLTVVLTEFGHVIGGFTKVPWTYDNFEQIYDSSAWLFVSRVNELTKARCSAVDVRLKLPAILNADASRKGRGMGHLCRGLNDVGPYFNGLRIANDCNDNQDSNCSIGDDTSFSSVSEGVVLTPLAATGSSTLPKSEFDRSSKFRVVDYEVFVCTSETAHSWPQPSDDCGYY